MNAAPLNFRWTGTSMEPIGRYAKEADAQFVIGSVYRMECVADRSMLSHDHQFAWLAEAWRQLPESISDLYPTPDHLRKRSLIQAGFYHEMIVDAGTNAAAVRVAAGFKAHDEFCMCVIRGAIVAVRTAKSQKRSRMPTREFQDSKSAIMEIIANLIGVKPEDLERNSGRAA